MQWTVRLETKTGRGEVRMTELVTISRPVQGATLADIGLGLSEAKGFCQLSRQSCRHPPADAVSLRCLKEGEHGCCTTEMKHATAAGGNMLVVTDARTELVSEFVVAAAEAFG